MDERAEQQLAVLAEIDRLLTAARIRFWLRGGWAIDFMLGRVTRSHADIDLVTWTRHRKRLDRTLIEAGFALERVFPAQTDFRLHGQDISFVYVTRAADGRVVTHRIPEWEWPPESLSRRRWQLHGLAVAVVSPERMLWEKETYEHGTGRPPRPKDLVSIQTLREMLRSGYGKSRMVGHGGSRSSG